jgi:hypothetical protein
VVIIPAQPPASAPVSPSSATLPASSSPATPHTSIVFATHRLLGSGVLHRSCSSEEIRLVQHPESLILLALSEALSPDECAVVTGARRWNDSIGESKAFEFRGSHAPMQAVGPEPIQLDSLPPVHGSLDRYRIPTSLIFLDAAHYSQSDLALAGGKGKKSRYSVEQYTPESMLRELKKAYVGFSLPVLKPGKKGEQERAERVKAGLPPMENAVPSVIGHVSHASVIHTGGWGSSTTAAIDVKSGSQSSDLQLKLLLQWMACSLTMSGEEANVDEELMTRPKNKKKPPRMKNVYETTLKKDDPIELLTRPPARSLVYHPPAAHPQSVGLEHFVEYVKRHPVGGRTEWSVHDMNFSRQQIGSTEALICVCS